MICSMILYELGGSSAQFWILSVKVNFIYTLKRKGNAMRKVDLYGKAIFYGLIIYCLISNIEEFSKIHISLNRSKYIFVQK